MQELQEAIEEITDFYLEKHGRVAAAAVKAEEDKRVRLDKTEQDLRKNRALETKLRQLRAEGDRRMRRRFFDLMRQRYLAVEMEEERVRGGKWLARFPAENYRRYEENGRARPSVESSRGPERNGLIYSIPINLPLKTSARGQHSTPSTTSLVSTSPEDSNPDSSTTNPNPATESIAVKTPPRLNPLANPFPDPSLGIQTQTPNCLPHHAQPSAPILPTPLPLPLTVPAPGRHGPSGNMAPLLPPAVYIAGAQLQERLRGVGPVRAVHSQMVYDQQRQTQHQTMREYELQRAKGRI